MIDPKFLLIRFSPGSAGRFLAALLMGSNDVAHFDPNVKTIDDKIEYIKKSFTPNLGNWLYTEPSDKIAWNITFVSNKYNRGHNLSKDEFKTLAKQNCTPWFHKNVSLGKQIIVPWNKIDIPTFYAGRSITIILDKSSRKWFNRAHWIKHFGLKDGKIHLKENDPKTHRKPLDKIVESFNNPIYIDQTFFSFVKNNILKSQDILPFYDYNNLKRSDDFPINLSVLLEKESCLKAVNQLCIDLQIEKIDQNYLEFSHDHWRKLHPF